MSDRFPCIAVYIMASRPCGVLYVGVTNDLAGIPRVIAAEKV